jgi:Zn-dependent protease with chaperone function
LDSETPSREGAAPGSPASGAPGEVRRDDPFHPDCGDEAKGRTYWEGKAQVFDGREARAREVRASIGPDGLFLLEGELKGGYRGGDMRLLEDEAGNYFRIALDAHPGFVVAFHGAESMEWMRASGLLKRPWLWGLSTGRKAAILLAVLAALSAFLYFVALDLAVEGVVRVLPRSVDRLLGETALRTFATDTVALPDGAAARALAKSRGLVRQLQPEAEDSVRILILPDTSVKNAFAFPDGSIVIFRGMLRLLETQEEWMALLAHEGAHVHLRHGMRGVVRSSILALGASLAFGDLSGMSTVLVDNAGALADLSYGRKQEAAADRYAQERLRAAGYRADGLVSLFRKLLALHDIPGWAEFLSSHPSTQSRIEALGEEEEGPGKALLTAEEWAALKRL